jgi:hypothetical protein
MSPVPSTKSGTSCAMRSTTRRCCSIPLRESPTTMNENGTSVPGGGAVANSPVRPPHPTLSDTGLDAASPLIVASAIRAPASSAAFAAWPDDEPRPSAVELPHHRDRRRQDPEVRPLHLIGGSSARRHLRRRARQSLRCVHRPAVLGRAWPITGARVDQRGSAAARSNRRMAARQSDLGSSAESAPTRQLPAQWRDAPAPAGTDLTALCNRRAPIPTHQ